MDRAGLCRRPLCRFESGRGRVRLCASRVVGLQYQIVEDPGARHWKVRIDAYAYQLLDGKEMEVVSYHWHPAGRSAVTWPHLLGQASIGHPAILLGAQPPTGRIALEQVIRLAVMDLGLQPRRSNWSEVIRESQETFERWGSWP